MIGTIMGLYMGIFRDYYRDPLPHSPLSTSQLIGLDFDSSACPCNSNMSYSLNSLKGYIYI